MYKIVDQAEDLQTLCLGLSTLLTSEDDVLYIDTEFQREKTYFPRLSLIQIATKDETYVIDTLSCDYLRDFALFLKDFKGRTIFFSGRQDCEIFFLTLKVLPKQVFDVQIALEALGFPSSTGFAAACQELLGITLDKSHQYRDWLIRPLKPLHFDYAAGDVLHLRDLYETIHPRLVAEKKEDWVVEDSRYLSKEKTYHVDYQEAWRRCHIKKTSHRYLLRLQALAAFREEQAVRWDRPRTRIMTDATLQSMAISGKVVDTLLPSLRQGVQAILEMTEGLPLSDAAHIKPRPAQIPKDLLKKGRLFLDALAVESGVTPGYLATTSEMQSILAQRPMGRVSQGWRLHHVTYPLMKQLDLYFKTPHL